jgi:hypothetical protein
MAHTTLDILLTRLATLETRVNARLDALESHVGGGEVEESYTALQASMRKLDGALKKRAGRRRDAQGSA